jgi:hypothetical protein
MRDDQSPNVPSAPVGVSGSERTIITSPSPDDDAPLLMLELRFNALLTELSAAQRANRENCPDHRLFVQHGVQTGVDEPTDYEPRTKQIEATLARLNPIEQAIMFTPAQTIVGLGVKARHAAYVMSQYWREPIDKIDWEGRAVRLLIEAVCHVAHEPFCHAPANSSVL